MYADSPATGRNSHAHSAGIRSSTLLEPSMQSRNFPRKLWRLYKSGLLILARLNKLIQNSKRFRSFFRPELLPILDVSVVGSVGQEGPFWVGHGMPRQGLHPSSCVFGKGGCLAVGPEFSCEHSGYGPVLEIPVRQALEKSVHRAVRLVILSVIEPVIRCEFLWQRLERDNGSGEAGLSWNNTGFQEVSDPIQDHTLSIDVLGRDYLPDLGFRNDLEGN